MTTGPEAASLPDDEIAAICARFGNDPHRMLDILLTVQEARTLAPHQNATGLQVSSAVLAGLVWALENPARGIVEADETYFVRSFKGHRGWKTGHPPENRPPRYCGSGAVSRGLSSEQVPVVTALDRNGRVVQGVLSERSDTKILEMLAGRIEVRSVICSDGQSSYPKVAQACSGEHRTIERPVHTQDDKARGLTRGRPGALGLGRVNAYHQTLKTSINRIFRGVSTRFLPNYLALAKHLRGTAPAFGFIRAALA